jgi:hypothetical protein
MGRHNYCILLCLVVFSSFYISNAIAQDFRGTEYQKPFVHGSDQVKRDLHLSFEDNYSLFGKIYFVDLLFNLDYIEPDYDGIGLDGVTVSIPATFNEAQLQSHLAEIRNEVHEKQSEWNKEEQGIYMAGCFERRHQNLMDFVMGRDGVNDSCYKSFPFCTGTTYNFPAGVNSGSAEAGAYYGCLGSQPNPAWYHLKIGTSGNIIITMQSNPLRDIDFICWGPFTHPVEPCVAQLTSAKVVSCSYSTSATEIVTIPNGISGEYYILLITNFSNQPCNIGFSQTGGTGTTDCTIVPPPINNSGPLCVGDDLELTVQNPIAGSTYSWSGPGGWTSTLQNPVIPNVTMAHAGEYTLVITLYGQTSDPVSTFVEIFQPPNPSVSGQTAPCEGSSYNYTAQNSQQGSIFEWVAIGGIIIEGQGTSTATIEWSTPGAGNVRVTEIPLYCAPVLSPPLNVTVAPLPSQPATPTGPSIICEGTSQSQYTTAGASNAVSYAWSLQPAAAGTITGTGTTAIVNWAVGYSGNATVHVNGVNFCGQGIASDQKNILIADSPEADAGSDVSIPHGTSTQLLGIASGGTPPYSYSWSPPELLENPNIANPLTINLNQTTIFTFTVTDANGCSQSDQVVVTITGGALSVSLSAEPSSVCQGGSSQLSAFPGGGSGEYTFSWTSDPPGFNSNDQNPMVTIDQTTQFTVVIDDGFNNASEQITVNVFPVPQSNAGPDKNIAHGTSVTLYGSASGGSVPYAYSWTPTEYLVNPAISNPQTINLYESKTFYLIVTDDNGCAGTLDSVRVQITGNALTVNPVASQDTICPGFSTQLSAYPAGGSGSYTYQWSSDPPGFSSTEASPVVSPLEPTVYHVTINDGYNTANGQVAVVPAYEPQPLFTSDIVCQGSPTLLMNMSSIPGGSIQTLEWRYDNAEIGTGQELLFEFPTHGYHDVTLTAISNLECAVDTVISVFVKQLPVVDLVRRIPPDIRFMSDNGDTLFVCVFNSVLLDAGNPSNPNQLFSWSVGAQTDTLNIGALGIGYELQRHEVTVTDTITGCSEAFELFVEFSMYACEFGIDNPDILSKIKVYPNPANDLIFIESSENLGELSLGLHNIFGQLLVPKRIIQTGKSTLEMIDVSDLKPGVYFIRLNNFDLVHTVKLIISGK